MEIEKIEGRIVFFNNYTGSMQSDEYTLTNVAGSYIIASGDFSGANVIAKVKNTAGDFVEINGGVFTKSEARYLSRVPARSVIRFDIENGPVSNLTLEVTQ